MISTVNYDDHSWEINNNGILKSKGIYNPATIFTASIQSFYMRSFIKISCNPTPGISYSNSSTSEKRPLKRSKKRPLKLKQESSQLLLPSSSSGMTTQLSESLSSSFSSTSYLSIIK